MVDVVVDLVVGDGEVVRIVVGIESVLMVVVNAVVGPHASLVPVRVHPVVVLVDL